jgi:GT2 family glycosyltransferase
MARVSVVLPFRNAERYLDEAIRSILGQTFHDFELIAVDDGSNDRSCTIVEQAANDDSRIRLLRTEGSGLPAALNAGIAAAEAPYIARMDGDDVALPERFALQVAALDREPGLVVIGSAVDEIDSANRLLHTAWYPTDPTIVAALLSRGGCCLCHPATMIRRDALMVAGGYRTSVPLTEDFDLWLRMMRLGAIRNLDRPLLRYRLHGHSVAFRRTHEQITSYLRSASLNQAGMSDSERTRVETSTELGDLIRRVDPDRDPSEVFLDYVEWYVERAVLVSTVRTVNSLASQLAALAPGRRSAWVEQCLRETATLTAASLGRSVMAARLWVGCGGVATRRSIWRAIRRPPMVCLSLSSPQTTEDAAGYLDRLSILDGGTQLMLEGWLPLRDGWLPVEIRVVVPGGGRVQLIRIRRRADVAHAIGVDHLHSGFRVLVRLDAPLRPHEPLPSLWTRSHDGPWRPLHQDKTIVDRGYEPRSNTTTISTE